ncbi:sensor histidine kinase [Microbispora sp. RL4-1S]|uniref:Oxygen sensor histidine kinase NreB n=1 Tax=Microbispora oryzae TaxID=2806554 RepID=A0A941AIK4_9ACTN|nr:sensor histidine kinase [Microbispora oryzae]MBP2703228.1 sensor histidine kinase [Microbispora oryzae]
MALPESALQEVLCAYESLLAREDSEAMYGGVTMAMLLTRAAALVRVVADQYLRMNANGMGPGGMGPDGMGAAVEAGAAASYEAAGPGTLSGLEVVHTRESLRAARALFQAALPVLLRELPGGDLPHNQVAIAGLLHRLIMEWLGEDTGNYLSYLLRKANNARIEERHQMARELHDRIAHTMSIALQSIELHEVYAQTDPARAKAKLRDARSYVREVLDSVRRMSVELRETAFEHGLGEAVAEYLRTEVPAHVRIEFSCDEHFPVPPEIAEEVYLVVREAIHNSLLHGSPTELSVGLTVTDVMLSATVRDDGTGFNVRQTARRRSGVGLTSMRERVELLGGRFVLKSGTGQGTTVEAHIPFLRGLL